VAPRRRRCRTRCRRRPPAAQAPCSQHRARHQAGACSSAHLSEHGPHRPGPPGKDVGAVLELGQLFLPGRRRGLMHDRCRGPERGYRPVGACSRLHGIVDLARYRATHVLCGQARSTRVRGQPRSDQRLLDSKSNGQRPRRGRPRSRGTSGGCRRRSRLERGRGHGTARRRATPAVPAGLSRGARRWR